MLKCCNILMTSLELIFDQKDFWWAPFRGGREGVEIFNGRNLVFQTDLDVEAWNTV